MKTYDDMKRLCSEEEQSILSMIMFDNHTYEDKLKVIDLFLVEREKNLFIKNEGNFISKLISDFQNLMDNYWVAIRTHDCTHLPFEQERDETYAKELIAKYPDGKLYLCRNNLES